MQTPLPDAQILLKRLSQGDSIAFWELWIPHQNYLYHCCLIWMDKNAMDAQDALSQTLLKAWVKLPLHAEKIINFRAWLVRFTHNLCMDIHRERSRKEIGMNAAESDQPDLLSSEMKINVRSAVDALPLRLRAPFTMRFEQELSYLNISRRLDISIDNVYKRISQARSILKPQMQECLSEENDSDCLEISFTSVNKEGVTKGNLNKESQQKVQQNLLTQSGADDEVLYRQGMQCLYCQSTDICKNGHRRGKQNYHCHHCDRQFINSYSSKGYPSEMRERCLKLSANGMGCRAIGRKTGISHNTVSTWVKQNAT